MIDQRIEAYLTRRIGQIRDERDPKAQSFQKSAFMLETSTFAEAGFMTHDERFGWDERMFREAP